MENDKIFIMIRESILVFSPLKETDINLNSNLSGDLALDSPDRLELVLDLEQKLDISIPTEDYSWCKTVEDVVLLINQIQNQNTKEAIK
ncbi:phosphopantetheine-binding protein [Peribacillus frigoritolerans]|uniref:phosphopantetheine-binding protein n=1 Tax=Peribacillus frigoritolerans TaxID=450367 RepID=UPI001F4FD047|nr:phosphopantetheine-binding protein [Peribacillus frigoritolerans]MCK2019391.1 phosphopantetheine-binding protein [Peribacillus frigoritolerans]